MEVNLLQRPQNIYPRFSLSRPLSVGSQLVELILREVVICILWPTDVSAISETTLNSRQFSYRPHLQSHMYFTKEFLGSPALGFILHLELK